MRKKKAMINSLFSMVLEVITIISGFILPRLFIGTFGSDTNGLVSSITSFIGYITLLQSGVGTVAKAAMYKPLANDDHDKLCVIIRTVENFFRKIALLTVIYIVFLTVLFPTAIAPEAGDFLFTASLVVIIGISTAAQYFFGITYQMLLEADQRSYIYSVLQITTVILNTLISVILIKIGCTIQIVKLGSAFVYVARPVVLSIYAKRKYLTKHNVKIDNSLINQRWDGFAQAIAYFIHSKTDIFVLTLYARFNPNFTLGLVSVYGVYHMVTTGLTSFIRAIERSVTSALGNIIAKGEQEHLIKTFTAYNTFMHIVCTTVFSTASVTIFRFIGVYVKNINDINYIHYAFGYIIIAAEYLYCVRAPYNSIIYAAGKFKETKISAAVEAALNIIISVILVVRFGLLGVSIGTFTAMAYRTISFMFFLKKDVIYFSVSKQIKRYIISGVIYVGLVWTLSLPHLDINSYLVWFLYASVVFVICFTFTLFFNYVVFREDTKAVIKIFFKHKRSSIKVV